MDIPTYQFEKELWLKGCAIVAGVDEVGRGAWAGPLVAAAVVLPREKKLKLLRDSKAISVEKRNKLSKKIKKEAIDFAFGVVEVEEINQLKNIYQANTLAFIRALENLTALLSSHRCHFLVQPEKSDWLNQYKMHVLLDGRKIRNFPFENTAIVKGDSKSVSIAAASILAKVERDRIMLALGKEHQKYQFGQHKGYGTVLHQKLLKEFGPSSIHRLHFKPFNPKLF